MRGAASPGSPGAVGRAVVDHAGAHESPLYLHEALTRRAPATPAAAGLVLGDVLHTLLERGDVPAAARLAPGPGGRGPPRAVALPGLTRAGLALPGGGVANTVGATVLVEHLRDLKRCHWPYPWIYDADDPDALAHGGFAGAARARLEGAATAEALCVNRAAEHRLERGIFTSTSAGDLRRAVASSERLVLVLGALGGAAGPSEDAAGAAAREARELALERRDLGALLLHAGRPAEAAAELRACAACGPAREAMTARERGLCDRLLAAAAEEAGAGGDGGGGGAAELTLAAALARADPEPGLTDDQISW